MSLTKMVKAVFVAAGLSCCFLIAGCASTPAVAPGYDPATQARIRVFHVGSVYLILGDVCEDNSPERIHASAGGFSFLVPNRTLGMPRTDDMPTFSFHEFVIPAGKTVTIRHYWQAQTASGGWQSYGPTYLSFRPEAGVDYATPFALSVLLPTEVWATVLALKNMR